MSAATKDKSPRLVKQAETADIYANGDGTNTAVFYAGPTNFFDKTTNQWRKIDSQLRQVGGRIENAAGPIQVRLPSNLSAADGVTVGKDDDWSASLTFVDATSKQAARINDGKVRYDHVAPGISLEYRMLTSGLKGDIILGQPLPATHAGRFRFQLSVSGATPVAVDGGTAVALQDTQGQEVARIPRGTMTDASGADGVVDMRLSQAGGAWLVDVVPDPAFLRSAERTYPIKIDPTLASFGSDTYANSICGSCNYNADPIMKAGRMGTNEYYSYVRFPDVTAIRGKAVTDATLHVVKHYSDDPTNYGLTALRTHGTWDPNTLNWSNKASHGPEVFTWGLNQDIYNFPITSWAQGWANGVDAEWINGNWSPYGATINTAGQYGYYELYSYENGVNRPELWITYTNQSPRVPTSLSPANGWTGTAAPPLSATLDDPDDSNGWIEFELDNGNTAIVPTVNGIASFTPFTGGTHTWRARGRDLDSSGPWTAVRSLTITAAVEDAELVAYNGDPDSGAPEAPSVLPFSPYSDPQTLSQPDPSAPAAALREGTTTLHEALTGEPSGYLQFPAALTDDQVRDKCRNEPQAAKDKGLVISHTRWCQTKFVRVTVRRGGQPHSWVTWRQTAIGRGNNGERNVTYTVDLDDFRQGGDPQTAQWIYGSPLEVSIACNPRWQQITCPSKAGVPTSETHTVGEWKDFVHRTSFELTSPEAGSRPNGDYDDKLAYYQFNLTDKLVGGGFPKGTVNVAQNEFRCDTAPYIYKPGTSELRPGCIFHKVKEVFEVTAGSKLATGEDNPEKESARHIYDAQFYPAKTWPFKNDTYGYGPQTDKSIPGSKKSTRPLTRNYYHKQLALDNYKHSKKTCEAYDKGHNDRGLECDEYPFKSTFQGSLNSRGHYSVCPITAADNSKVGGRLSGFNGTQRILHAIDEYYVEVVGGSIAHKTGCPSRGEDTFNPPPCAPNCPTEPQWNPAAWTTTSNSSSNKVIGTYSGEGELKVTSSSVRATSELAAVADSETSLRYRFSDRNAQSAFRVTLRGTGGTGSAQLTTGYRLEVASNSASVKLQKIVNGTVSTLATIPYTQTTEAQWLRFEVKGSTVRARLWAATAVEPSAWSAQVTNTSVTGQGQMQLAHSYTSGAARSVFVDDLTILQTAPPNELLLSDDWTGQGASVVSDGFETSSLSGWSVTTGGDGTAAAQTATVKTGNYSARLSATAVTGSMAYARKTLSGPQTHLSAAGAFQIAAEGVSGSDVPILRLFDSAGNRLVGLYRQNQSGDQLWVQHSGGNQLTSGRLPLNQWANLDLQVALGPGVGDDTVEVRLNGTSIYKTTTATVPASIASVQLGQEVASQAFTIFADDVSVTSGLSVNGGLWNSSRWLTTTNDTAKRVDIQNNQGRLLVNSSSARATAVAPALANSEVLMTYAFDNRDPRSFLRIMLRGSGATGNGARPTGYRLELRSDSPTVKLQRCVNSDCGSGTPIASASHTMTTEPQRLRYQAYGQNIRVKVWAASQPEPVDWTIDITDSAIQGAGALQISHNFDTASHAILVDDLTYWKLV